MLFFVREQLWGGLRANNVKLKHLLLRRCSLGENKPAPENIFEVWDGLHAEYCAINYEIRKYFFFWAVCMKGFTVSMNLRPVDVCLFTKASSLHLLQEPFHPTSILGLSYIRSSFQFLLFKIKSAKPSIVTKQPKVTERDREQRENLSLELVLSDECE